MKIVISQPMFFPWIGIFEQIKLCDIYVHYDDVQIPQGRSFVNRVQIKTPHGIKWLTVPLKRKSKSKLIKDTYICYDENWTEKHLKFLSFAFNKSPFKNDMLEIVDKVYSKKFDTISQLNIYAISEICNYFGLSDNKQFLVSSEFKFCSTGSQHLLDIIIKLGGSIYITGWGAKNYIDYALFEKNNIDIQYMDYEKKRYPQLHGEFTPFVSILDLIANTGKNGIQYIVSKSKSSKIFIP